jgi:iron complex outermembrane receptor protein
VATSLRRGWTRTPAAALRLIVPTLLVVLLIAPSIAIAQESEEEKPEEPVEEMLVKGQQSGPPGTFVAAPTRATPNDPDTAKLLQLIPGGDVVSNGPLTGQVQYRGMFGDRVGVQIDGMSISPGGPNWMDAPLHYAPRPILDRLEVDLGIASVSSGSETIGGSARAELKRSEFAAGQDLVFAGDVEAGGRVADESFAGGGILAASNESHRLHLLGSAELGDDYRVGSGGRIRPSEYERYQYGGGYGYRLGDHEVGLDYRYNDTKDSGTPVLPMDIRSVETHLAKIDYAGELGEVDLDAAITFNDIDHVMNNYSLRTPPAAGLARWRKNDAESSGFGWSFAGDLAFLQGSLELGVDGHHANHDARVTNPNAPGFFVRVFDDARKTRFGTWAEWKGDLGRRWNLELGLRYTRVEMDSDEVDGTPAQTAPPATRLRDAFNAADRSKSDDLVDAVVKFGFAPRRDLRLELSGGRKTRAASYIERYGWIPTQAAGGLADGHNYVGDVGLDPEVSYEAAAEVEWNGAMGIHFAPRAFYRRVYDYIQGIPSTDPDVIAVSTVNGDVNPLQFSNVDARLYGVDVAYGAELPWHFHLDGTLSYVRADRLDENDDLYRIAPLRGRTTLTFERSSWSLSVESMYAAAQKKVSETNDERRSKSWGILNVFGTWEPFPWLGLVAGVNNVLDENYSDHLAGTSRVTSSGVDAGERLPSPGVSFFGRAVARF